MYACAIHINKAGDTVVCSNYIGANIAFFKVREDGNLSNLVDKIDFAEAAEGSQCSDVAKKIKYGPEKSR